MELKSSFYPAYLNEQVGNMPKDALMEIIEEISSNAKFYMNSDLDGSSTDRVNGAIVAILQSKYKYFSLSVVTEAFHSGSLGELGGTTKFTVRNVAIWLNASREKYERARAEQKTKEDNAKREAEEKSFRHTRNNDNLFGTALWIKTGWNYNGTIKSDDWDNYTLDAIVAKLREGYTEKTLHPSML
jgi:hypothetical protein